MRRATESDRSSAADSTREDESEKGTEAAPSPVASLHGVAGNQAVKDEEERAAETEPLPVSDPGDRSEQEADRIAAAVLEREPVPEPSSRSTGDASGGPTVAGETAARIRSLEQGGRRLPAGVRSEFEPRLGRTLGDVRIHTGPTADRAARSIDAAAFTVGSHIAFAHGEWRPDSPDGRSLLAHELAHVAQADSAGTARQVRRQGHGYSTATTEAGQEGVGGTASTVAGVTDILTVLDVAATGAELASSAASVAQAANVVGMLGALGTFVFGMIDWADALQAQKKLGAVQGASYALVSIANGREPPGPHDDLGSDGKAAWNRAARDVKSNLEDAIDAGGEERDRILGGMFAARDADPMVALNRIYQRLVEDNLQDTFLFIFEVGGTLYDVARGMFLQWPTPGVSMDYSYEQIQRALENQ